MIPLTIAAMVTELAADIMAGRLSTLEGGARRLLSIASELMPADDLHAYLTQESMRRANLAADVAETVKFGNDTDPPPPPDAA